MHDSDIVTKLQKKLCTLEASKDSEVIDQVECHDLEATNSNTIQQLQWGEHASRLSLFGNYWILKFHDSTQDTFSPPVTSAFICPCS